MMHSDVHVHVYACTKGGGLEIVSYSLAQFGSFGTGGVFCSTHWCHTPKALCGDSMQISA